MRQNDKSDGPNLCSPCEEGREEAGGCAGEAEGEGGSEGYEGVIPHTNPMTPYLL